MKRMLTIAGKEFRAALSAPLGYAFLLVFVLLSLGCFFFEDAFFAHDQATARGFFRFMPRLLLLFCPMLTMRLWADERRLGTYEILATLPLKPVEMVLGKFLASLGLLAGGLLFTLIIPIVAEIYGDLDWGPVWGGYIGALLLGSAYLAIGLFCSALVQDQFVALLLGIAACALTLLPDQDFWNAIPLLRSGYGSELGFEARFNAIERGVLDFSDLAFYLAIALFWLVCCTALTEWRRYSAGIGTAAKGKIGVSLLTTIVLVGLNVGLFVALTAQHRIARIDLTDGNLYSLNEATKGIINELEEEAKVIFYYSSEENQHELLRPLVAPMRDTLREFSLEGGEQIETRFIELDTAGEAEQKFAKESYGVRPHAIPIKTSFKSTIQDTYFGLVVASGAEYERIDLGKLIRPVERSTLEVTLELSDIEFLVAQALKKLNRGFDSVPAALISRDKRARLSCYLSEDEKLPKSLAKVRETLTKVAEQMARRSGGRLELEITNPLEGRPEAEHRRIMERLYRDKGVRPMTADYFSEETFYAWLQLEVDGKTDGFVILPEEGELTEADLKDQIEGALKRLVPGFLTVVGIASKTPPMNPMMMQMGQRPPPDEFAPIKNALSDAYEVRSITLGADTKIPPELDVLVLLRPSDLDDKTLFEIDQFVMRGGRLVVCADAFHPDAQRTQQTGTLQINPVPLGSLSDMLASWGCKIDASFLQDSRCDYVGIPDYETVRGMRVATYRQVQYRYLLRLDREAWAENHPIAAGLVRPSLMWAAPLDVSETPPAVIAKVIASTSKEASSSTAAGSVHNNLGVPYVPPKDAKEYPVIVTLEGNFASFFKGKPIPGLDAETEDEGDPAEKNPAKEPAAADDGSLPEAIRDESRRTSIVVIGDSDFVSLASLDLLAQSRELIQDNLHLLQNAMDWGGADGDLLQIRNRPPVRRPLTKLAGMKPEDREATSEFATFMAFAVAIALTILLGAGWYTYRKTRPAIELLPAASSKEGSAS